MLLMLGLGALVGGVCLIVYSGIALGHDSRNSILGVCPDADLWTWLLVVTIIMGVQMLVNSAKSKSESEKEDGSMVVTVVTLIITLGLQVGLAAWGGPMILSECAIHSLQDTQVWYLSFIHFVVQLVVVGLVGLVGIGSLVVLCSAFRKEGTGEHFARVAARGEARV
jgi:hypothetical protein